MISARAVRGLVLGSAAAMLFIAVGGRPLAAQKPVTTSGTADSSGDNRGGVRGGPNPVQVTVKLAGKSIAGATVTIATSATASTPVVTVTTDDNGSASTGLAAGSYVVTATTAAGSATKTVTVVDSSTTVYVDLALKPTTP